MKRGEEEPYGTGGIQNTGEECVGLNVNKDVSAARTRLAFSVMVTFNLSSANVAAVA